MGKLTGRHPFPITLTQTLKRGSKVDRYPVISASSCTLPLIRRRSPKNGQIWPSISHNLVKGQHDPSITGWYAMLKGTPCQNQLQDICIPYCHWSLNFKWDDDIGMVNLGQQGPWRRSFMYILLHERQSWSNRGRCSQSDRHHDKGQDQGIKLGVSQTRQQCSHLLQETRFWHSESFLPPLQIPRWLQHCQQWN